MAASAPAARGGKGGRSRVRSGNSIDDIAVGLKTRLTKTVSESDVYLFAGITGDLDPNHVDEEYCRKTSLGHRVAHGALIVGYTSAASTRILQDFDRPMVSVGYDRIRFLKPVYFGDTLTIDYEIESIEKQRERTLAKIEVKNQRDELVMVATHIMQLVT
jgi:acyl dehydratase